jgi:cell division protein FtsB
MIDPSLAAQVAMVIGAAVIGGVAGGWRGMAGMKRKANDEVDRAMAAQRARIDLLENENRELRTEVALLKGQVRDLRADLDIEKRITARFTQEDKE